MKTVPRFLLRKTAIAALVAGTVVGSASGDASISPLQLSLFHDDSLENGGGLINSVQIRNYGRCG